MYDTLRIASTLLVEDIFKVSHIYSEQNKLYMSKTTYKYHFTI